MILGGALTRALHFQREELRSFLCFRDRAFRAGDVPNRVSTGLLGGIQCFRCLLEPIQGVPVIV